MFAGNGKEGMQKFCDLVRGTASTEQFKISGSKQTSGIPFMCLKKSKCWEEMQKAPANCSAGGIPLPSVPHRTKSCPEWEGATSWKCSLQATEVQDVQAVLKPALVISYLQRVSAGGWGIFPFLHIIPVTGGRAGHSQAGQ